MPLNSDAQKLTLRTHIQANATVLAFSGGAMAISAAFAQPTLDAGDAGVIADWYNLTGAAGTHTAYKSNVSITQVGDKINGTELAGLSSLNSTRLQTVVVLSAGGVNPSLADRRQFFDDIFSGAGGQITRASLLALWKRLVRNVEKVFATGTGSDASPATLTFEGSVNGNDIQDIHGLPA
jgi:hypothetical protein